MDFLSRVSKKIVKMVYVDSLLRTSSYVESFCPRIDGVLRKNKLTKVSSNTFYDLSRIVTHCPSDTDSCLGGPETDSRDSGANILLGIDLHLEFGVEVKMKAATQSIIPLILKLLLS